MLIIMFYIKMLTVYYQKSKKQNKTKENNKEKRGLQKVSNFSEERKNKKHQYTREKRRKGKRKVTIKRKTRIFL